MLDEAIEYLKSLQMQVQMMSMGYGMVPVMFSGVQQYMSPTGMGMMNRPLLPVSSLLPNSTLSNPCAAAHMASRFPLQGFHMPSVPLSDPFKTQATGQSDVMSSSLASQNTNPPQSSILSSYQQHLSFYQPPGSLTQNQGMVQPNPSKLKIGNSDNHRSNLYMQSLWPTLVL